MPDTICPRTGKTGYPSKSAAPKARAAVRNSSRRRKRDRAGEIQVFKCETCGDYHLSHLMRGSKGNQGLG